MARLPKKGQFRQRAHANPFSDHDLQYPQRPESWNWQDLYPEMSAAPDIVDIGCGYGGLLVALSPLFPQHGILGLEIRQKVVDYVSQRIAALRENSKIQEGSAVNFDVTPTPLQEDHLRGRDFVKERMPVSKDDLEREAIVSTSESLAVSNYQNIAVLRSNSMKYLVNFFGKHSLGKIFILFPDPHFKRKKHKARIVTPTLLAEYAYCLRPGGRLYVATDVAALYGWMTGCVDVFPLFRRLPEVDALQDPCVDLILNRTEESHKVDREGRTASKQFAVYERLL